MQNIYLLIGEEQKGPFSENEVNEMYAAGTINPETLHWREDLTDWQALGPRDAQTGEPKSSPKTIAPPRRTLRPGKYPVEHKPVKSEDEIEEEISRSSTPFKIIKTLAMIVVFFVFVTGMLKILSHSLPDVGKKFAASVSRYTGQH
jgi:hypothetical protein